MNTHRLVVLAGMVMTGLFALACGGSSGGSAALAPETTTTTPAATAPAPTTTAETPKSWSYSISGTVDNSVLTKTDLAGGGYQVWALQSGTRVKQGTFGTSGSASEDASFTVSGLASGEYTLTIYRVSGATMVETMSTVASTDSSTGVLAKSAAARQINMFTTALAKILAEKKSSDSTYTVAKAIEYVFGKDSGVTSIDAVWSDAGLVRSSGNAALAVTNPTVKLALSQLTVSVSAINLMTASSLVANAANFSTFSGNVIRGAAGGNVDNVLRNASLLNAIATLTPSANNLYNRMLSADPIGAKAILAASGNSSFVTAIQTMGSMANSSNATILSRIRQNTLVQTAAATKLAAIAAGANITKFDNAYNLVVASDSVIKSFISLDSLATKASGNLLVLAQDASIASRTGVSTTTLVSSANTARAAAAAKPSGATNGNKSLVVADMKQKDPLSKQRTQVVPGSKNAKRTKARMASGKATAVSHGDKTPSPRSQGETGSCSSWAAAYYKSWQENMEEGWGGTSSDAVPFFSPMYLFSMQCQDMAKFGASSPYSTDLAADIIKAYGCPLAATVPYHDYKHGANPGAVQDALEIAAYAGAINTDNKTYATLAEARTAVTSTGDASTYGVTGAGVSLSDPAAVYANATVNAGNTINAAYITAARKEAARYKSGDKNTDFNYYDDVTKTWKMKFDQLKETVRVQPVVLGIEKFGGPDGTSPEQNFFYKKVDASGHGAGHAIVCIGFNDDKACPDGTKGAWLLRNSWGKDSGENGDTWLPYSAQADLITSAMTIKDLPNVKDVVVATPPASPDGVSATSDKEPVTVTWNKVSAAKSYKVYRKEAKGKFALVGKSDMNSFIDYPRGGDYWYVVTAVNEKGESKMLPTDDGVKGTSVVAGKVEVTSTTAIATVAGNATVAAKDASVASAKEIVITPFLDVVSASGFSANIMVSANVNVLGTSANNILVNELSADASTTVLHFLVADSLQGPWVSMGYTAPARSVVLVWEARSDFVGDAPLIKAQFMDENGNTSGFSNIVKMKKVQANITDTTILPRGVLAVTATASGTDVALAWTANTASGNADTIYRVAMKDQDDPKAAWVPRTEESGLTWSDNVAPQGVNLVYAVVPVYAGIEGAAVESNGVKVAIASGNPVSIENAPDNPVTYTYDATSQTLTFGNLVLGNYGSSDLAKANVTVAINAYQTTVTVGEDGTATNSDPVIVAIGTTDPGTSLVSQTTTTCSGLVVAVPSAVLSTTSSTMYIFSLSANLTGTTAAQEVTIDTPWSLDSSMATAIGEQFAVSENLTAEDGTTIDASDIVDESAAPAPTEEFTTELPEPEPEAVPADEVIPPAETPVADPVEGSIEEPGSSSGGGSSGQGASNGVTVTLASGNASLAVSWPAVDGIAATTIYWTVESTTDMTTAGNSAAVSGNAYVISALANDQVVYVAVQTTTTAGTALISDNVSGTPGASGEDFLTTLAPAAVTLTIVSSTSSNTLDLSWTQSADADFASYAVYMSTSAGVTTSSTLVTTSTSAGSVTATVSSLSPSTTYYARVFTTNTLGVSSASNEASAVTADYSLSLTKGEALQLATQGVFAGIVHDGSNIVVSYAKSNNLYIRPYDTSFTAVAAETQLTSSNTVTDHKHVFFSGSHYLLYSTTGDQDLYLIKLSTDFTQVGSTVAVATASTNTMTNDMLLAVDGTHIVTGQFRPSNLNNNANSGHYIKTYDTDLNLVSEQVANAHAHVNTASLAYINGVAHVVAPSTPVSGGQVATQRDLKLVRFDSSWAAVDASPITLVDSTTITHTTDGSGIWMSTGLAYDASSKKLIVGHTFVEGGSSADTGRISLRVFGGTSFTQVSSETMVDLTTANRAHFLLLGDTLYVVYDVSAGGIWAVKYSLTRS